MSFVLWIVVGLILGAIARSVMPGPDPLGGAGSIGLGIGGGLTGGAIGILIGSGTLLGFNMQTVLTAIIGSLLVMFCYRAYALRWEH